LESADGAVALLSIPNSASSRPSSDSAASDLLVYAFLSLGAASSVITLPT